MQRFVITFLATALPCLGIAGVGRVERGTTQVTTSLLAGADATKSSSPEAENAVIGRYCVRCHNDASKTGGLTLESFDVAEAHETAEVAEKMIRKLQAGLMPPPPAQRPDDATVISLLSSLTSRVDDAAAANPRYGGRTFQRLNRAEYERSIADLLGIEVDAAAYLPADTVSAGFDNIADVQGLSATVMEGYLQAASEISRLAVGDPNAAPGETKYTIPRYASQREHVEGAPFGTRGGISVVHHFPADGQYFMTMAYFDAPVAFLFGKTTLHDEQIEISINGERVALLDIDRWMDADNESQKTEPIFIRAGPQRVSAAFLRKFEGPIADLMSPFDWSLADRSIGSSYGITTLPHLRDLTIAGPYNVTGVSATPSRERIFSCRPTSPEEELPCAEEIVTRLGTEAYRRHLTASDRDALMGFYEAGASSRGFEVGIRAALEAMLASPHFVFRFEERSPGTEPTERYRVSDLDLASRLSFFLWASPPDDLLLALARQGQLSDPAILEQQVWRMLADRRAESLGTRFAGQWLRLQDLDKVHPDTLKFPDHDEQLADAMRRETELFFSHLVQQDRSLLELLTADYTFVNERLGRHYGIPNIAGDHFRRVQLLGEERRGLLGHGSILTLTSHANRTSPVLRGKWIMAVLLGTPPPPPPPNIPDLEETEAVGDGRLLTVREAHGAASLQPCLYVVSPSDRPAGAGARELRCHRGMEDQGQRCCDRGVG